MSTTPTVSVVVPTFQRRASLARLLDALASQTRDADFEVVVVDDGSRDDTRAWLRGYRAPYPLRVLQQANGGPATARNRGVNDARGDVIVFLDDDVVPAPDAVSVHAAAHRGSLDRVVVGPMLPPASWRRPSWVRWEEQKLLSQYEAMSSGRYPCSYRQFFTGNASLRRDRFIAAGGFDPSFDRAEDVELGYRLSRGGSQFTFEPAARVWHYPSRSFATWKRTPFRYGRADVAMYRDKGQETLAFAYREVANRHPFTRALIRFCLGSNIRSNVAVTTLSWVVRAADALHVDRLANASLSALFHVLYWHGVCHEVGGRRRLREAITGDPLLHRIASGGVGTPGMGRSE